MKEIMEERNRVKKEGRSFTKEYEQLKEELGYESADCSRASVLAPLPSDDELSALRTIMDHVALCF